MKRFGASLIASLLLASLAACSKAYSPNLPPKIITDPAEQLGCVLASISRNTAVEPHFRTYEFIFRSRNAALSKLSMLYRADYGVITRPEDDTFYTNFDENGFAGIVYMRNVPAGTYFADKAKFVGGAVQLEAAKNTAKPFEVAAGGCTYVGELRVTPIASKGLMGNITLKSVKVDVVNSWARDYTLFKKIYPELDAAKVSIDILQEAGSRIGTSVPQVPKG